VQSSKDAIIGKSLDGIITSWNKGAEEIYGYTESEIIGKSISVLIPPDIQDELPEILRKIKLGENIESYETVRLRKDGQDIYVSITVSAIYDDEGSILGASSLARDITERKRLENLLIESETQYRLLFETANDGILLIEKNEGKIAHINPSVEKMLGYSARESIGNKLPDVGLIIDNGDFQITMKNLNKRGILRYNDVPVKTKSGKQIYTDTYLVDKAKFAQCNIRDITERKRAEDELRKSEENFRHSLEDSPLGICVVTAKGETIYANKVILDIYGCANIEEMNKIPLKERYTPQSYAELQIRKKTREDGDSGPSEYEINIVRKNGEIRHLQVLRKDVLWNGIKKFQVIYQDITDRKRMEVELQQILDSLKKAVSANIQIMVSAVEMRDPYTAGHQIRSANLACVVATEMGLPQDKIDGLRMASSIHDIGKLSIPAEILSKPTKLTDIEFSLIKEHSQSGYEMLKNVESPWPLAQIVYQHHERMNGSGYPRNLKGDEILIEARIMAVADVVEAMASHRPYRSALGIEAALEEIEKNKGILYDNDVAVACLRLFREKGYELIAQKITGTV
jgi:PAS domain S-box-containing protein